MSARRENGICYGSLWKQHTSVTTPPNLSGPSGSLNQEEISSYVENNVRSKMHDYCILIGNCLMSYTDLYSFRRGDHPTSEVRIVGASAWNPSKALSGSETAYAASTFRVVTYAGTHIYCTAPSRMDRDTWLAALHAGLEASYTSVSDVLSTLTEKEVPPVPNFGASTMLTPPNPQRLSRDLSMHRRKSTETSNRHSSHGYTPPYEISAPPSSKFCVSCGRFPPEPAMKHMSAPLPQYGLETPCDLCQDCLIAQGLLSHVQWICGLYEVDAYERASLKVARELVTQMQEATIVRNCDTSQVFNLPPEFSSKALLELVGNSEFAVHRRRSRELDKNCSFLESGVCVAEEFLENIMEVDLPEGHALKKEAFRVAGDMGTAMKLLHDYAFPSQQQQQQSSNQHQNTDMLQCIFEFLIELCEDGELSSVAFFWPQLCAIHLGMLPPRDTASLVRVELMEDFLTTVSAKYSIHLGLELAWGLVADLEESLGNTSCSTRCRFRRFAVMRFACELESLLFDFDGGWDGGNVSLAAMLAPSEHQATLIRDAISTLQLHRRFTSTHSLSKSARLENLRLEEEGIPRSTEEATRVRQHADYYSSQIRFARKLGDIAEKLRFMDVDKRAGALENEINLLNQSHSNHYLGGDPLNRVLTPASSDDIVTVIHVPPKEGHVFRSKERTPVLLLMETIKEGGQEAVVIAPTNPINSRKVDGSSATPVDTLENDSPPSYVDSRQIHNNSVALNEDDRGSPPTVEEKKEKERPNSIDLVAPSSPKRPSGALKRFESPGASTAPVTPENKKQVESLVNMMSKELGLPELPVVTQNGEESSTEEYNKASACTTIMEEAKEAELKPEGGNEQAGQSSPSNTQVEKEDQSPPQEASSPPSHRMARSQGVSQRKMTAFGGKTTSDSDIKREVLTTIMVRGMRGHDIIAQGAAPSARNFMQAMDRQRAVELIMNDGSSDGATNEKGEAEHLPDTASQLETGEVVATHTKEEEDEAMESLRLLLIQNRVAQGALTPEFAARVLAPPRKASSEGIDGSNKSDQGEEEGPVDAGDLDPRLAGCGPLSHAVLSALKLWKTSVVTNTELLELVQKDLQFVRQSALLEANQTKLQEDSAFWVRFAFGERWAEKRARVAASSVHGSKPGWDLVGVIVKSNDDLRQEAFIMQLIELCHEAFQMAGLELWVQPYKILATGRTTGIIEMVRNALSFDSLKKREGYAGLRGHLTKMSEYAADPEEALNEAKLNFARSLAAYSLMSYFFLFKDRHNGNLLLDTAGHVIHIDFGFVFGIAPGGSFSLEMSTPFKLTEEMIEVMDGMNSPLFSEFVTLFCCGFLALQAHADTFLTIVEITAKHCSFKCFDGKDWDEIVSKLRERFCPQLNKEATVAFALELIKQAANSYGTSQYDYFQYLSQGIAT